MWSGVATSPLPADHLSSPVLFVCMYMHVCNGYPRTTFGNWVSPSIVGSGDRTKQGVRQVIFTFMCLLTGPQHFHFQMPDSFDQ